MTKGTNRGRFDYEQLIPATRELLATFSIPTVIENVQGSDLRRDVVLCGEMFGLGVIRHRYFEVSNAFVMQPQHIKHRGYVTNHRHREWREGPYTPVYGTGGKRGDIEKWKTAMGIDWMATKKEIAQAIPPAYTKFIGEQLLGPYSSRNEEVLQVQNIEAV